MKNNTKLTTIIFVVLLSFLLVPAFAQPGPGQGRRQQTEEDVKIRVNRLADTLDLSEAQTKKIMDFELETYKKNQKMFAEFDWQTGDREAMRAAMMKQREERQKKYREVLDDKQMETYTRIMEQRRQNMQNRRENSDGQRDRGRGRN